MEKPEHDPSGRSQAWQYWFAAEDALRSLLARSRLPTSSQEAVAGRVLFRLLSRLLGGKVVDHPFRWVAVVARKEIWRERRSKGPLLLGREMEDLNTLLPLAPAPPLPDDPWAVVLVNECMILARLTKQERRVYEYVRDFRRLKGCADQLAMSPRDVRTRFRRICQKLSGILGNIVPPPPLLGSGRRLTTAANGCQRDRSRVQSARPAMLHILLALFICILHTGSVLDTAHPRSRDIVIPTSSPPECKCKAATYDAKLKTTGCCPDTPDRSVSILVEPTEAKSSKCKVITRNEQLACDDDRQSCGVVVTATLMFPSLNGCDNSGGVTGPGIGTQGSPGLPGSPCQTASLSPVVVSVEWTLTASCRPGEKSELSAGEKSFKFWCDGCNSGQPPGGDPDLEFNPGLSCEPCK